MTTQLSCPKCGQTMKVKTDLKLPWWKLRWEFMLKLIGGLIVTFYFIGYDTTVREYNYEDSPRIHNVGRMHNRVVGIMVGLGLVGAGVLSGKK